MKPRTVLMVHWNNAQSCAAALRRFIDAGLEAVVLDNDSDPAQLRALKAALPSNCRVVQSASNIGFGPGLNVLLRQWLTQEDDATVLVSAHDTETSELTVEVLGEVAAATPAAGIVSAQFLERPFVPVFTPVRGMTSRLSPARANVVEADHPHGTLMLLRRDMLIDVGLFDERYFAYGEEADLGVRARKAGWRVVIANRALMGNPTTTAPSVAVHYLYSRNTLLLARDYGGPLACVFRSLLMAANSLRMSIKRDHPRGIVRARWCGLRDGIRGRYGPLPTDLIRH